MRTVDDGEGGVVVVVVVVVFVVVLVVVSSSVVTTLATLDEAAAACSRMDVKSSTPDVPGGLMSSALRLRGLDEAEAGRGDGLAFSFRLSDMIKIKEGALGA